MENNKKTDTWQIVTSRSFAVCLNEAGNMCNQNTGQRFQVESKMLEIIKYILDHVENIEQQWTYNISWFTQGKYTKII